MSLDVGALYERYEPAVRHFVCDRLRDFAAPDSEDVAATVWERVARNAPSYADTGHTRGWVLTIANNLIRDYYRSSRWKVAHGSAPAESLLEERHPSRRDRYPSDYAHLYAALDDLTPEQRNVVELFYWHELPFAQIAERIGTTENGVKKLAIRARARMRRHLERTA